MKYINLNTLFLSTSFLVLGCGQNADKEKVKSTEDSLTGQSQYVIDTLEIPKGYIINSDTSYLFNYPDSNSRRSEFLLKNEFLQVSAISNGFGYATHPVSSDSSLTGWVNLSTLESIAFTPPKGAIIDSTK